MRITHRMRVFFVITVFCVGALLLTGCAVKKPGSEAMNSQIKVFNTSLFAATNNGPINGVSPRREECISGYAFYYDDLDIVTYYHDNDRIWKITTRNNKTSMFGIAPGDSFAQAKEKITRLGFSQGNMPHKFAKDWCLFTLLVDEKNNVFGMTVEIAD